MFVFFIKIPIYFINFHNNNCDFESGNDISDVNNSNQSNDIPENIRYRKNLEYILIRNYDKSDIDTMRECWFMIDAEWLNNWTKYVTGPYPEPGRIMNNRLFDLQIPQTLRIKDILKFAILKNLF